MPYLSIFTSRQGVASSTEEPISFTLSQLEACTDGFNRRKNLFARGGFGVVYRGNIGGRQVAIKESRDNKQRTRIQWEAEVNYLPRLMHQNIINLIGYCEAKEKLYLVYPFMNNGTVKKNLSKLDWSKTVKIIKGAAMAIQVLHSQSPPLIYRDLKPDNLLLDKDFTPKLADFGTVTPEGEYLQLGSDGYTDPIVMHNGEGARPNDIYSLGVVILQLIMQKEKVTIPGTSEGVLGRHISEWAQNCTTYKSKGHAVNEKLRKGCSRPAARAITKLGLDCVNPNTWERPTIDEVIGRLLKDVN